MYRLVILALALSSTFFVSAQTNKPEPEPGYAVSVKGDTLFGNINYMKKSGYRQSMQIKFPDETTKMCNARNYKYIKAGDQVFESFEISTGDVAEKQFFWRKASGKIDFYEYQYEMYRANNMVTQSEYYIRVKGTEELIRINGANFRKKLAELVQDNPQTTEKIESKETKLEDLEEILIEYNKG